MLEIKSPEDLSKIIDLCRKKGVQTIKLDGVELSLREEAPPSQYKRKKAEQTSEEIKVEEGFNSEDILFWSSQGIEGMN